MGGSSGAGIPPGEGVPGEAVDCPRKFTATLVDVPQFGNAEYGLNLQPGSEFELRIHDGITVLVHQELQIGALPPTFREVPACIQLGWRYLASLLSTAGTKENPKIRVTVVGVPT
jgi:hypothetical protein